MNRGYLSSTNESGEGAGPRSYHLSQSAVPSADILKKAVVQLKALRIFIYFIHNKVLKSGLIDH